MLFGHLARMDESADGSRILTTVPQSDWKGWQDVLTHPGWPQWRMTYHTTTLVWKMPPSWHWTDQSGGYWQQAELLAELVQAEQWWVSKNWRSYIITLSYPAFWLCSHLYSAHAVTHHLGHYNRYYILHFTSYIITINDVWTFQCWSVYRCGMLTRRLRAVSRLFVVLRSWPSLCHQRVAPITSVTSQFSLFTVTNYSRVHCLIIWLKVDLYCSA